jgi:hypothetical protein
MSNDSADELFDDSSWEIPLPTISVTHTPPVSIAIDLMVSVDIIFLFFVTLSGR